MAEGKMEMVIANGKEILLARVGDNIYATQNNCPHMGGNLSHGALAGTILTCPRHHSQFDVRDGRVLSWTTWPAMVLFFAKIVRPPRPLKTYPVTIEGGNIYIET